jgi:DnaK suppressor protein
MKTSERDALKALLLEQRDALLGVVDSGEEAAQTVELDQSRVGRLSRMDALQAQAMAKESDRRRQLALQRIASALGRIEDDDYGSCFACGEDIPMKRLQVNPAVTLCIGCADSAERGVS